jgi:hypothetical protein
MHATMATTSTSTHPEDNKDTDNEFCHDESCDVHVHMAVIFGRPGAGKTTVADAAYNLLKQRCTSTIQLLRQEQEANNMIRDNANHNHDAVPVSVPVSKKLDLDVAIPQWMKDNFAKGIYPTFAERQDFAKGCCQYVRDELGKMKMRDTSLNNTASHSGSSQRREKGTRTRAQIYVLISFSFVNTDLRDVFRSAFPDAIWILIHTLEEESNRRIQLRKDHFYQGKKEKKQEGEDDGRNDSMKQATTGEVKEEHKKGVPQQAKDTTNIIKDNNNNSQWDFAPVTYPHIVMSGLCPVEDNAATVVNALWKE